MLLALGGLPFIVWGQEPMTAAPRKRRSLHLRNAPRRLPVEM